MIVRKENTTVQQMQPLISCQGLALATDVQEHNTVPGTNLGFSERHGFLAKAQGRNIEAQIRYILGTFKAQFRHSLWKASKGTVWAQLGHILGTA